MQKIIIFHKNNPKTQTTPKTKHPTRTNLHFSCNSFFLLLINFCVLTGISWSQTGTLNSQNLWWVAVVSFPLLWYQSASTGLSVTQHFVALGKCAACQTLQPERPDVSGQWCEQGLKHLIAMGRRGSSERGFPLGSCKRQALVGGTFQLQDGNLSSFFLVLLASQQWLKQWWQLRARAVVGWDHGQGDNPETVRYRHSREINQPLGWDYAA